MTRRLNGLAAKHEANREGRKVCFQQGDWRRLSPGTRTRLALLAKARGKGTRSALYRCMAAAMQEALGLAPGGFGPGAREPDPAPRPRRPAGRPLAAAAEGGASIVDELLALGWSFHGIARRMGVHRQKVRGWRSGRRPLPPARIVALAELLPQRPDCLPRAASQVAWVLAREWTLGGIAAYAGVSVPTVERWRAGSLDATREQEEALSDMMLRPPDSPRTAPAALPAAPPVRSFRRPPPNAIPILDQPGRFPRGSLATLMAHGTPPRVVAERLHVPIEQFGEWFAAEGPPMPEAMILAMQAMAAAAAAGAGV
jgi:hypothetical protein